MKMGSLAVLCSVSAFALAAPAYGQAASQSDQTGQSQAQPSDSTDAIIVTARRREESVQEVPQVINTVTSENIAKLNLQNFTEVQSLVPGLQLSNTAIGLGANAQLRGITYDVNASTQPSVQFYLNDASLTSVFVLQQMYDIAQVEVERGPQGTLRGRSSPSGAISVTTKRPDLEAIGGYISMSGSDIGTLNTNAALSIPIIRDVLAVRAAGLWTEDEGNRVRTIDKSLGGVNPHSRTWGGRVSAVFKPADWLRVEGIYQHSDYTSKQYDPYASFSLVSANALASPRVITPGDRLSIEKTPIDIHSKYNVFNWRAEGRFAGQVLIYQGQHATIDTVSINSLDPAGFFKGYDPLRRTTSPSPSATDSHEIRLQNDERLFGAFDYVVGYLNWRQNSATTLVVPTPVLLPPFLGGGIVAVANTTIQTEQRLKENSFFGNITAHVGDKFELSGGVRHIHFQSPANNLVIGANTLPGAAEVDDNKWIYTASAQYFVTPDVMVYASTGTSYRPGPTIVGNFSPVQSDLERSFTYLKAEKSTNYEVGIKSSLFDHRVRLNLTGFHQKFDNYPYKLSSNIYYESFTFVPGTGLAPVVANGSQFAASVPVEVNGIEAELGFKVTPRFDLSIVAAYSDGKIKNGAVPCDDLNRDGVPDTLTTAPTVAQLNAAYGTNYVGACRVNQRSSNQSPFSATVQAEYQMPISDKVDFFTRGLFTFQGNSINDPANAFDSVGSYGILNMFAGIRDPEGAWEVNFFAKNLFDTAKATTFGLPAATGYQELQPPTFTTTAGVTVTSPYSQIITAPPREFGLNVRFAFGSR